MQIKTCLSSCFVLVCFGAASAAAAEPSGWLGFRGDGTSAGADAPATLSIGDDGNLAWQREMPGESVAGPIIIGDLIVTTSSAGQDGEAIFVSGIDLATGETRWQQSFRATGRPYCHPTSANAAPTSVSDGERIYSFFSSNDLVCLSLDGELIWYRGLGYDYPQAGNDIGMASSPTLIAGVLVVQVEAQGDSFAAGIDAKTGKNLWRIKRPTSSNWSSPVAIDRPDGSTEVVLSGRESVVAVDPRTGAEKWRFDEGRGAVPSATPAGRLLLLPGDDLLAVNTGDSATMPEVTWRSNKVAPRNASVIVRGDRLYALKGSVLVAASLSDGEVAWQERLSGLGGTWSTPVVAGDRIYLFDQSGHGLVVQDLGESAETVSEVELEESVMASPAIAGKRLIVRGKRTLFCFE
jgi:outer membrane protein assembly factor BamB